MIQGIEVSQINKIEIDYIAYEPQSVIARRHRALIQEIDQINYTEQLFAEDEADLRADRRNRKPRWANAQAPSG